MTVEISMGPFGIDFLISNAKCLHCLWERGNMAHRPQTMVMASGSGQSVLCLGSLVGSRCVPPQAARNQVFDGHSTQTAGSHLPVHRRAGGALPWRRDQCFTNAEVSQSIFLPNDLNNCTVSPMLLGAPTRSKPITLCGRYVILYSCLAVAASLTHLLISLPTGFTWEIFLIIHFHKKSCLRVFFWDPKLMIPSQQPIFFFFLRGEEQAEHEHLKTIIYCFYLLDVARWQGSSKWYIRGTLWDIWEKGLLSQYSDCAFHHKASFLVLPGISAGGWRWKSPEVTVKTKGTHWGSQSNRQEEHGSVFSATEDSGGSPDTWQGYTN